MSEPTPTVTSDMTESVAGSTSTRSFKGRGGRGQGCGGGRRRGSTQCRTGVAFNGNTGGMNGHVLQCFDEGLDKKEFSKTVEALGEYAAKNLDYPGDLSPLFKTLAQPTLTAPADLPATETSKLALTVWDKKVATYCKRLNMLESNLAALFAIIWGQCSEAMKAKLVSLTDYETHRDANDCVWLLKEIKGIMFCFEGQRYLVLSLVLARSALESCRQGPDETLAKYLHQFRSHVEAIEHYGGGIGRDPELIKHVKTKTKCTDDEAITGAQDRTLALDFLRRSDQRRFGTLFTDLENQFS